MVKKKNYRNMVEVVEKKQQKCCGSNIVVLRNNGNVMVVVEEENNRNVVDPVLDAFMCIGSLKCSFRNLLSL